MSLAPVVLFVYNRPLHTLHTLQALSNNDLANQTDLIIYCDGPKEDTSTDNLNKVAEVRKLIRSTNWCKTVTIYESNVNKGLANSIIYGVTQVISTYHKIIVLEDDIIIRNNFLKYMNDALNFYENCERVMQISGYQYPIKLRYLKYNTVLHRRATSWGWATWKRAWDYFNPDIQNIIASFSPSEIYKFNINGCNNRYNMLLLQQKNEIDSWAIRWGASIHLNNGLVVWPISSLIENIGHDGSGTHCSNIGKLPEEVICRDINTFSFPTKIEENKYYLFAIKKYYSDFKSLGIFQKLRFYKRHLIQLLFS